MRPFSKTNKFTFDGTLDHRGSVLAISISPDGKILATGGSCGTLIWNYTNRKQLVTPGHTPSWGATTAIVWRSHPDEPDDLLAFGTQSGHLVFWRQMGESWEETFCNQLKYRQEVTGLAFDPPSNRLLVANRAGVIQSLRVDKACPEVIFSVEIEGIVPKAIAFGNIHGDMRSVLVFDQLSGYMLTLRGDGTLDTQKSLGRTIGDADVNVQNGVFCIDDSGYGVALYRLDSGSLQKTFQVKNTTPPGTARPKQVAITNCGSVVSGSDHGHVYIFDRRTGESVDELVIQPDKSFQTVMTASVSGSTVIFTGKSRGDVDGHNSVYIFKQNGGGVLDANVGLSALINGVKIMLQVLGASAVIFLVAQRMYL